MGLNTKQAEFTQCLGEFITWCFDNGYPVILAEAYRTPEQAALNADAGVGILNSVHCKKLAADMFRVKDGTVTWAFEDYEPLGAEWKTKHDDARWGGDFGSKDAVHFSFEHKGFK